MFNYDDWKADDSDAYADDQTDWCDYHVPAWRLEVRKRDAEALAAYRVNPNLGPIEVGDDDIPF